MSELNELQRVLGEALTSSDPQAALARARTDPTLASATRRALGHAREPGTRLTALFVARLRFERLIQGSTRAAEWFDRDPAEFAQAFRRYHMQVAPTARFPSQEAARFEAWCACQPAGQPTGQPTAGQPTTGQPTGQPTAGQPTTGQPTTGQPTTGQPTTGQPTPRG